MTIVEFLGMQLDNAERRARGQAHWADGWLEPAPRPTSSGYVGAPVRPKLEEILADIESKRAIIAQREQVGLDISEANADPRRQMNIPILVNVALALDTTIKHLASVYADDHGYQQEWKP